MENIILNIVDLTHDGRGVARHQGRPVFVRGAYPGETIIADIIKDKKSFLEGKLQSILVTSPDRIESVCSDFDHCGGCDFCDLKYENQLEFKRNRVKNDLKKFAGVEIEDIEIHGMDSYINHRNHVQLSVKNGLIGYNRRGTNSVFTPRNCIIAPKSTNEIIEVFMSYKELTKLSLIGIRSNYKNELMVILVSKPKVKLNISELIPNLQSVGVTHIYQNFNDNPRNHYGKHSELIYGEGAFYDELLGYKFEISPTSFFQVNRPQAEELYKLAIESLEPNAEDKVLELYSGIGTISLPVADRVGEILGIEYSRVAVEDAKKNAANNEIKNAKFKSGKAEEEIFKVGKDFNKVLMDPPRSGVAPEVIAVILKMNPERIVYVSCNPATLARDIKLLTENGEYRVDKVDAVDMFGLSYHVETVCLLSKKVQ